MTDIVNEYFKQFYPAKMDAAKWEFTSMLGGMRRYKDYDVNNIFPRMLLGDGTTLSVQAHYGTYSSPRDDFADRYAAVEIGFPSKRIEDLMPYIDGSDSDPTQTVYGYVPVAVVEKVIADHGGLVGPVPTPDAA